MQHKDLSLVAAKLPLSKSTLRLNAGEGGGICASEPQLQTPVASVSFHDMMSKREFKLNKLEKARLEWLKSRGFKNIQIQSVTFAIGDDCRFTPDFSYISIDGRWVFEDVKGFQRDDALVKIKAAATQYPHLDFCIVKRENGLWNSKPITP